MRDGHDQPPARAYGPAFRLVRGVEHLWGNALRRLDRYDSPALRPWLRLARSRDFWRFVRFLASGGLNFAFYYSLFTALHLLGVAPGPAVVSATVVAVLFNFTTTGRLVFGDRRWRLLPRFVGVYCVQGVANVTLLGGLIRAGVPVLQAEALVIVGLAIATFFALRRFVFSPTLIARTP